MDGECEGIKTVRERGKEENSLWWNETAHHNRFSLVQLPVNNGDLLVPTTYYFCTRCFPFALSLSLSLSFLSTTTVCISVLYVMFFFYMFSSQSTTNNTQVFENIRTPFYFHLMAMTRGKAEYKLLEHVPCMNVNCCVYFSFLYFPVTVPVSHSHCVSPWALVVSMLNYVSISLCFQKN